MPGHEIVAVDRLSPFAYIYFFILIDELEDDVNLFALALLYPVNCTLLDPWRNPFKNSTSPCASPTVGANCHGIVTSDVLV